MSIFIDLRFAGVDVPPPADERDRHFGGGQTRTTLDLPPGEHSLQLLLADHTRLTHEPPLASVLITIAVTE